MSKRLLSLLVAVLAMGLLAAGCGSDDSKSTSSSGSTTSTTETTPSDTADTSAGGVDSGSAELRAGLTSLLQEHVYLAGIAVANGVGNGLDSAQFKAAAGTLDTNSQASCRRDRLRLRRRRRQAVPGAVAQAHRLLRRLHHGQGHQGQARATPRPRRPSTATAPTSARSSRPPTPNLPADAVAEELKPHVQSLFDAIDAVVAGKANAFDKLQGSRGPHADDRQGPRRRHRQAVPRQVRR